MNNDYAKLHKIFHYILNHSKIKPTWFNFRTYNNSYQVEFVFIPPSKIDLIAFYITYIEGYYKINLQKPDARVKARIYKTKKCKQCRTALRFINHYLALFF
jgi:hypothetical protein